MPRFHYRGGELDLTQHTHIMGILNITPDSFSDGGRYDTVEAAVERALAIQAEGADVLDIGAQSTRPGHIPVTAEEEWSRLRPVLEVLSGRVTIPVSIDTYYPEVAARALEAGAHIINDVSGSLQNGMPGVAARYGAGLVMMHAGGGADDEGGADAAGAVRAYFLEALEAAEQAGLAREAVCLDPGIGFGKPRLGDVQLIAQLPQVHLGSPKKAIGTNTESCMLSGSVLGTAVLIDGMVQRIEEELGSPATLVVTGGLAKYVTPLCRHPLAYDPELLMKGLALLYQLNAPQEHGRSHGGGRHYGQQGRPRAKHPYPNRRTRREPETLVG